MGENERENLVERVLLLVSKGENDGLLGSSGEDGLDVEVLLEDLRVDAGRREREEGGLARSKDEKEERNARRGERDPLGSVSLGSAEVLESELLDGLDLHSNSSSVLSSKVFDVSIDLLEDLFVQEKGEKSGRQ